MVRAIRLTITLAVAGLLSPAGVAAQSSASSFSRNSYHSQLSDVPGSTPSLFSVDSPWQLGGWTSAGFTVNGHRNRSGNGNAPLPQNNVADAPVLNQLWLYADKPLNLNQHTWDWGFRVDYVFGTDGPEGQAAGDQGWDFGWNSSRDYGSAIPQLFGEIGSGDLILRAGYAFGLQGFEALQAVDNFFYSHNYAFGYGVPSTFSGVEVDYTISDDLNVIAGWTTGWDSSWANHLNASTFMGGLTWAPTPQTSLTYHVTAGDFGDGTAQGGARSNQGSIYAHAIVLTWQISESASWVCEHTLGDNANGRRSSRWYSVTNYLFVDICEEWSAGARLETFHDKDGFRVNVNGAGAGSYSEATLGLNWQPSDCIRVRPELRWDWFDGTGQPFDSRNGGRTGTTVRQFTAGMDVVLTF